MFTSLRKRLLFSFGFISLLAIGIVALNYMFNSRINKIHEHRLQIDKVYINILRTLNVGGNFINFETIKPDFYTTGESNYLKEHAENIESTKENIRFLIFISEHRSDILLRDDLINLNNEIVGYQELFESYVKNLQLRGFEEIGVVGDLNKSTDKLFNLSNGKYDALLGQIKLAEMQYQITFDTTSVSLQMKLLNALKEQWNDPQVQTIIEEKSKAFREMVRLDNFFGFKKEQGHAVKLQHKIEEIEDLIAEIDNDSKIIESRLLKEIFSWFALVLLLQILVSIFLTLYLANRLSKPIKLISTTLNNVVSSDFKELNSLENIRGKDELAQLGRNVNIFMEKLEENFLKLEKNQAELEEINSVLKALNAEIKLSENKLKHIDAVKNKIFSIVAHDLRVPFVNMSGFLEAIRLQADSFTPDELKAFGERMTQTVSELRNLSTTIIQWAIAQSEGLKYNPQEVDMEHIFQQNIDIQEANASSRLLSFETKYDGDAIIQSDPDILNFVLRNLITNAIRKAKVGGQITLSYLNKKSQFTIEVDFEGIEFSNDEITKMFDMASRIDSASTTENAGLGIGLALCRDFIRVAEGEIIAQRVSGRGSKFVASFMLV